METLWPRVKYRLNKIKKRVRRFELKVFYRSSFFRMLKCSVFSLLMPVSKLNVIHLVNYQGRKALGPLQREEALFMNGLIKVLRPKTVLEFGFASGHSAFNFLSAMEKDSRLYSVDISDDAKDMANFFDRMDERFCFIHKSQDEVVPPDFNHREIDFVFIDASHDANLNKKTFKNIRSSLSERVTIAVHDTGIWIKKLMSAEQLRYIRTREDQRWLDENRCTHQPGERKFVNWISDTYPEFNTIHLHTENYLRHGISLLQKQTRLQVPEEAERNT